MSDQPKTSPQRRDYDVFIGAPMSSLDPATYSLERNDVMAIIDRLSTIHGLASIYFAGTAINRPERFTSEVEALRQDLQALRDSRCFVLVYPSKIVTSALVEVGYALALRVPCLLLVRDRRDLPYLLSQAESVGANGLLPPLKIRIFQEPKLAAEEISAFYREIV